MFFHTSQGNFFPSKSFLVICKLISSEEKMTEGIQETQVALLNDMAGVVS